MVKDTQAFRQLLLKNCLSVFDHFLESALQWLINPDQLKELLQIEREAEAKGETIFLSFTDERLVN